MPGFKSRVNYVATGAPATSGNVNRAPRELLGNDLYLKALIDAASLGQALFARDQTLNAAVKVGQPVYWDADAGEFKQARIDVDIDATGQLVAAASAEVFGVCYSKANSTLGDILVLGVAELDMTEAIDESSPQGRYYLSSTDVGKLTKSRPSAAVYVLYAFDGKVFVCPTVTDFLNDHVHYSFQLACKPAGTPNSPAPGGRHEVAVPNANLEGWLPADHAIFAHRAPAGAAFGYNLTQHSDLNSVWPPIPASAAVVVWDKGDNHVGGTEAPLGPTGLVQINADGIWWMSNCYDDVPWPRGYNGSSSQSQSLECPRDEKMSLRLDFIRLSYASDKHIVTSAHSLSPLLTITNCNGDPATLGDLYFNLQLSLLIENSDTFGSVVIKTFDPDTQTFESGYVLEGIKAGVGVTIAASRSRLEDPEDAESGTVYQGIATVSADVDPTGKELAPSLVRSDNALQRFDGDVMYISLMPDSETGIRASVDIPPTGLGSAPTVAVRVVFVATAAGAMPAVTLTILRVPRPSTPATLPSTETSLTFDVAAVGTLAANKYFEVESSEIAVAEGDTLFYSLVRAGDDGYDGELGIIRHGIILK